MEPINDPTPKSVNQPSRHETEASIEGRPKISLDTFRLTALEVAEKFHAPVAICKRQNDVPGSASVPYQNKFLDIAEKDGDEILETIYPPERGKASDLNSDLLSAKVREALANVPGGERLDAYFGISSGIPEGPPEEAIRSDILIEKLKSVSNKDGDLSSLLGDITRHVNQSGADPDILRALRGGKQKNETTDLVPKKLKVTTDSIVGCLLGTTAGDSIGLPYEGLSPRRQQRLFGNSIQQRLIFGKGMISDDTEHAVMLTQALIETGNDIEAFKKNFAHRLKWWIAFVPSGVGFGTLRATLKLWFGRSPDKSGVFSAGNGPCMRSPMLGLLFGDNPQQLFSFVRASTYITHSDPRAFAGALAVSIATHVSATSEKVSGKAFLDAVAPLLSLAEDKELTPLLVKAVKSVELNESTIDFAKSLGLEKGVSGFVLHTVPVVIHAWLRSPDNFRTAIENMIRCGGDTDTTSAIVGAIIGARVKETGIPSEWLKQIWEPTFDVEFLRNLGTLLGTTRADNTTKVSPSVGPVLRLARNGLFLGVILRHGFRRLLPPY